MNHRHSSDRRLRAAAGLLILGILPGVGRSASLERSTVDRPDDSPLYQIHVLYVLPSDGADARLDVDGAIETSLAAAENWFATQTGGSRLRLDTYQGALDISFFRMSRTDAKLRSFGAGLQNQIEAELLVAGFTQPNKLYAVYYGGGDSAACGSADVPPGGLGAVAALYLHGTPPGAPPCSSNSFATSPKQTPGYLDMAMVHEIVHTLGFVPPCAPHATKDSHVNDDPRDLMYAGRLPWRPSMLDVGHDDYFEAHLPGCLDLSRSAFLDPLPDGAAPPPLWPMADLPKTTCDQGTSFRSQRADVRTQVRFVNTTPGTVRVYWLNYEGGQQLYATLAPWQSYLQSTFLTHPWKVTDAQQHCLGVYLPTSGTGRVVIRPAP